MEENKNKNRGLIVVIIIMLTIILIASLGIVVLTLFKKEDATVSKKNKSEWISYSYDLETAVFPLEQNNYDVGYTVFENDRYRISINNDKKVLVNCIEKNESFLVDNIDNAKKIIVGKDLDYIVLTEDGNVYGLLGKAIDYYANPKSEDYEKDAFKLFKSSCETDNEHGNTSYNCSDQMKFKEIYRVSNYYSGTNNINRNDLFFAIGEDNNIYQLYNSYHQTGSEQKKSYFEYSKNIIDDSIEKINVKLNNNTLLLCSYNAIGVGLNNNGTIGLFKDDVFLDNKILYNENEIKVQKMICNISEEYFIGEDNVLYKLNHPTYVTYSSTFNLENINDGRKIKSISYRYKEDYYDYNSNKIKDIVFIFDDGSEYKISDVYSGDTYGILLED